MIVYLLEDIDGDYTFTCMNLPVDSIWEKIVPEPEVGFTFDYYVCKHCKARVTNEMEPDPKNKDVWYPDGNGSFYPKRQRNPDEWEAKHESWCKLK